MANTILDHIQNEI